MNKTRSAGPHRLSLSSQILLGIAAGIGCGVFFGEHCGWLKVFGDASVGLMQMAVLPYITVSLVANIGRLSVDDSRRLAGRAGLVLLLLWGIAALTLVVSPIAWNRISSRKVSRLFSAFAPAHFERSCKHSQFLVPHQLMPCDKTSGARS